MFLIINQNHKPKYKPKIYMIKENYTKLKGCLMMVALLLLSVTHIYSQQNEQNVRITGKVTDEKGEGLIGVSVLVKGTKKGTSTDLEGNYTVDAPTTGTLVFTYI